MSKRKPNKTTRQTMSAKDMILRDKQEYLHTAEQTNGAIEAGNILIDTYPQLTWGAVVDAELITKTDQKYEQVVEEFRGCEARILKNQEDAKETMEQYSNKKIRLDDAHFRLLTLHQEIITETINLPLDQLNDVVETKVEYSADDSKADIDKIKERTEAVLKVIGEK